MRVFAIDNDNTITAFPSVDQIPEGQQQFASEKELASLVADWPGDRLVETWNSFAGVAGFGADLKPVKKFTNRATAVKRIWNAIQGIDRLLVSSNVLDVDIPETTPTADEAAAAPAKKARKTGGKANKGAKGAPKAAKASKTTKATKDTPTPREGSKKAQVIALLSRAKGVTLRELMEQFGWQAHTVRGFMAGAMKKAGYKIESFKNAQDERCYRVASK